MHHLGGKLVRVEDSSRFNSVTLRMGGPRHPLGSSEGEKVKRGLEIYEIIVVYKCLRAITRSTLIV